MITDLKLVTSPQGYLDLSIVDGKLETVSGLETALQVSLQSDQRASETQVSDPLKARGFIIDLVNGFLFGSRLWLTKQRRVDSDTANDGADFIRKGLFWLIEDGLARSVDVTSQISSQGIRWDIIIDTPADGVITRTVRLWRSTFEFS